MRPWWFWLCWCLAWALFGAGTGCLTLYCREQRLGWILNHQQFGFYMLKGGYRSYTLSWCEGDSWVEEVWERHDGTNRVTFRQVHYWDNALHRRWRFIPRYSHSDVRPLIQAGLLPPQP